MARYIKEFEIKENGEKLIDMINKYILYEGYQLTLYNNEQVFVKENDRLDIPSFLKTTFQNDTIRLEAWKPQSVYRGKLFGETYFSGIAGLMVKEPIKKRVAVIEKVIKQHIDENNNSKERSLKKCIERKTKQSRKHINEEVEFFKNSVRIGIWFFDNPTLKPDKDGNVVFSYQYCVGPGQWHRYYVDAAGKFWDEYRYFEHEEPYDDYCKIECNAERMISKIQYIQSVFAKHRAKKYVKIYKRVEKFIRKNYI